MITSDRVCDACDMIRLAEEAIEILEDVDASLVSDIRRNVADCRKAGVMELEEAEDFVDMSRDQSFEVEYLARSIDSLRFELSRRGMYFHDFDLMFSYALRFR